MIPGNLCDLGAALRAAASRRAYGEVQRLAEPLCAAARGHIQRLPVGDPQIGEIAAWMERQLECAVALLRVARAVHAAELRQAMLLQRFLERNPAQPSQVRING